MSTGPCPRWIRIQRTVRDTPAAREVASGPAPSVTGPHIEILEVHALRIDASGRVGRLRVIGVADRDDERIEVDVCVADLDRTGADWVAEGQQASGLARIVDPERTKMGSRAVQFWDVMHFGRHAYQWVAEIDVLLAPGVPPLIVGLQQAPLHARAYYIYEIAASMATLRVLELAPAVEFDAGVLLVHGIGMQRRSETLSQWSAPLARWITAWLRGATDEIARQLQGVPLESWRKSLADVPLHPSPLPLPSRRCRPRSSAPPPSGDLMRVRAAPTTE